MAGTRPEIGVLLRREGGTSSFQSVRTHGNASLHGVHIDDGITVMSGSEERAINHEIAKAAQALRRATGESVRSVERGLQQGNPPWYGNLSKHIHEPGRKFPATLGHALDEYFPTRLPDYPTGLLARSITTSNTSELTSYVMQISGDQEATNKVLESDAGRPDQQPPTEPEMLADRADRNIDAERVETRDPFSLQENASRSPRSVDDPRANSPAGSRHAKPSRPSRFSRSPLLLTTGGILITVMLIAAILTVLRYQSDQVPIQGHVVCTSGSNVVGVWVASADGKGNFATLRTDPHEPGSYFLGSVSAFPYSLHVGCGGTSRDWGVEARSPELTLTAVDLACDDSTVDSSTCTP